MQSNPLFFFNTLHKHPAANVASFSYTIIFYFLNSFLLGNLSSSGFECFIQADYYSLLKGDDFVLREIVCNFSIIHYS